MVENDLVKIVDVTNDPKYKRLLYRCIFHDRKRKRLMLWRKHVHRRMYLDYAIRNFRKKVLFYKGEHAGAIEYAPAEASGIPIEGENVVVMNCIWIQKQAAGHHFGKRMVALMMADNAGANGFATLGCEVFHPEYVRKDDMERLGFKPLKSIRVRHKGKRNGRRFKVHLMWMPMRKDAKPPTWDETRLMEGLFFCEHHPLFHGRHECEKMKYILEKCRL